MGFLGTTERVMRVSLRGYALDLADGDGGQKADKQQEQEHELTEASDEGHHVDPSRSEITPTCGQVIAMEGSDNDHEPLEPHANIDDNRNGPNKPHRLAAPFKPEKMGADDVAGDHAPIGPPVWSEGPVLKGVKFVGAPTIPGDEELHSVGISDHRTGRQDNLAHEADVTLRYNVFQLEECAHRNHEGQHHAESRKDGTGNEVRGENGRVPTGNHGHSEVERHDRVHRQHQRRTDTGEDQVGLFVVAPMAIGAAPTQGKDAVSDGSDSIRGAVTQGGEVGD